MNKITITVSLCLTLLMAFATQSYASTVDCQNLYVGRINIAKGIGLRSVVYLNNKGDNSGSYWSNFNGWTAADKKDALAILTAAKISGHRINVFTKQVGCGLQNGPTTTDTIHMTTSP